jgi:acyl carrier protein
MVDQKIEESIISSLRKLGCDAASILPVHELQGDLGIDSTEMIELAALVRGEFGITAHRINLQDVKTVADLGLRVETLLEQVSDEAHEQQVLV